VLLQHDNTEVLRPALLFELFEAFDSYSVPKRYPCAYIAVAVVYIVLTITFSTSELRICLVFSGFL
jgi:hypothetical protein